MLKQIDHFSLKQIDHFSFIEDSFREIGIILIERENLTKQPNSDELRCLLTKYDDLKKFIPHDSGMMDIFTALVCIEICNKKIEQEENQHK